jgi:hypothetical protein
MHKKLSQISLRPYCPQTNNQLSSNVPEKKKPPLQLTPVNCTDKPPSQTGVGEEKSASPCATETTIEQLLEMMKKAVPNLSESSIGMIETQLRNSTTAPQGMRWDDDIMNVCMQVWTTSPQAYEHLRQAQSFVLPTPRTLSSHKNEVKQIPGINATSLEWMALDAKDKHLPPTGCHGGLVFDEMAIQEDLYIKNKEFIGFAEMGREANKYATKQEPLLAFSFCFLALPDSVFLLHTTQPHRSTLHSFSLFSGTLLVL